MDIRQQWRLKNGDRSCVQVVWTGKALFRFSKASKALLQRWCNFSMVASFSEGLLISEKVGLNPKVLVEVFSYSSVHKIKLVVFGVCVRVGAS
ncbi:glyoxylate reductase (NADP(+)) [Trifolium repens]|nr:glyoxylate reductase (NADP(+)) [Trifolium repens]